MKKFLKAAVALGGVVLALTLSACTIFDAFDKVTKEIESSTGSTLELNTSKSEVSTDTTISETSGSTASTETTVPLTTQVETLQTTVATTESSQVTTQSMAQTIATSTTPALLTADNFHTEDILKNGALYARRASFDPDFIEDALTYFPEIAGGNEFDQTIPHNIIRWDKNQPIRIGTYAQTGPEDLAVLNSIIPAMRLLTELDIDYAKENDQVTHEIYVTPLANFSQYMDFVPPDNWGLFNYWNDADNVIYRAKIAVSTDKPNREEQNHLLIEEFVQSFGLVNDSERHIRSIFQQEWTNVQAPDPLDWLLLEFLYRPEIYPGMPIEDAVATLRGLYLN